MIIINGDIKSVGLGENLDRFLKLLEWCSDHDCDLNEDRYIINVIECDRIIDCDLDIGVVYSYSTTCRTCNKRPRL
jgi:hypothetical protein